MQTLTWEEFVNNVYEWSKSRGILDQATIETQIMKTFEEIGEYATARTDYERQDAIGDIAVCLVNALLISGEDLNKILINNYCNPGEYQKDKQILGLVSCYVVWGDLEQAMSGLSFCKSFKEAITQAWNEIKDRRGMMIDGFYVKWDNLTEDQKAEAEARGV